MLVRGQLGSKLNLVPEIKPMIHFSKMEVKEFNSNSRPRKHKIKCATGSLAPWWLTTGICLVMYGANLLAPGRTRTGWYLIGRLSAVVGAGKISAAGAVKEETWVTMDNTLFFAILASHQGIGTKQISIRCREEGKKLWKNRKREEKKSWGDENVHFILKTDPKVKSPPFFHSFSSIF